VLFFYPKDDTPGCTVEAKGFRDHAHEFEGSDAIILGISPDSVASHCRFREKYGLPFTLLADTDHAVAERYGVWREKSMFGRKFWGVVRTTFLIDREGRVAKVFEKVDPATHAGEVLHSLAAMDA
jgi:thioredoxin-dependent peroxiredoxin